METIRQVPSVVFLDILDQYSFNTDLTCSFKFSPNYKSRGEDSLAIFKLGWSHISEYIAMKCLPKVAKDTCSVIFNRHMLPRNTLDLFQICYISGNDLHGASTPFQFYPEDKSPENQGLISIDSLTRHQNIEKDQEIKRLKEENDILKQSLKTILASGTDNPSMNYKTDIKEIKDLVQNLKSMLLVHDSDIKMLKNKIQEVDEENKQLALEKAKVQKEYDMLKGKYVANERPLHSNNQIFNDFNLDLGDLQSIPPFPSMSKS